MTPKQKKKHKESLEMARFLGLRNYTHLSDVHLRTLIERRKREVLNVLGIDLSNGLDQTQKL